MLSFSRPVENINNDLEVFCAQFYSGVAKEITGIAKHVMIVYDQWYNGKNDTKIKQSLETIQKVLF